MTISLEQALNGVASFVENDMIPKMPNGLKKLATVMAVETVKKAPAVIAKPYEGFFKMVGVLSEDGKTVDMDMLSKHLKNAFSKVPSVDLWGFTFEPSDADRLVTRMGGV